MKRILCLGLVLMAFCLVLLAPAEVRAWTDKIYKDIATFSKVLDIVDKLYVQEVNEDTAMEGAINGLLQTLDPHSIYMAPEAYKSFNSETKGRFGGIGIEVSIKDGILTVVSPLEGTPAWDAGIKAGDKILTIDGQSTKHMSLNDAVKLMRGPVGKALSLTIWREGKKGAKTVNITREMIKVSAIRTEDLGDGYAMFKIITFQEGVAKQLWTAIEEFVGKKGELKGMILDLRDNPGGLLTEAVRISDFFIAEGVIVSTKGRSQETEVSLAHKKGTLPNFPMIVLINEGSASASEILAGALKDHKRARILGTNSFGKGSVQTLINLENGGAVKITIAHYFTPKDKLIDGKGIPPDIKIDSKGFLKKNKTKFKKDKASQKIERDEFYNYQRDEALSLLKKTGH